MPQTLLRVDAPIGVPVDTFLASSPAWKLTEGPADWVLTLRQRRSVLSLELSYAPAGIRIHSASITAQDLPQTAHWAALLRRFVLTRPVTAVNLIVTTRNFIQLNRGLQDFVEPDMRLYVVRQNQKVAEVCVVGVQEGDSIARIIDWGRGIKPEDTVIRLWVP